MRNLMLVQLLIWLCAGAASGDEVHLRSGRRLVGRASWTDDGRLRIETRLGTALLAREEVAQVIACELPEEVLARRRAGLAPDDLHGRVELAGCALRAGLEPEARELLLEVVGAAPAGTEPEEPAGARRAAELFLLGLDYHQVDGRWVAPEVYYPARGCVRRGAAWIPAADLERERREAAEQTARASAAEAERERARAELDLRRAEEQVQAGEEAVRAAAERARAAREAVGSLGAKLAERARAEARSDLELAGKWSKLAAFRCQQHGRDCPDGCKSRGKRKELQKKWEKQKAAEGKDDVALARVAAELNELDGEWRAARKVLARDRQRLAEARDRCAACRLALDRLTARAERAREAAPVTEAPR
jgi:hypothetical protein